MDKNNTITLHTGREIPALGLGTWQLTHDTAGTVEHALELGYRMVDTSGDYGTQPGVGQAIRHSGLPRDEIYLVTKVEEDDDAYEATKADLTELGLDYADLMLIHRPPRDRAGVDLWEGLIRARADGLARDIGVSNYSVGQIRELEDATGELPTVNQVEWTPFGWGEDMFDFCSARGVVIQAYSPLTRGERLADSALGDVAKEHEKTPAQVLLRWNLQRGTVPIPKANQRNHLVENLQVFDFELRPTDIDRLNGLNPPRIVA